MGLGFGFDLADGHRQYLDESEIARYHCIKIFL